MRKKIILLTIAALFGILNSTYSQCKSFTRRACMPELSPYVNNGQINSTYLYAGDEAEVILTFYSGQNYRLLCCNHEILGDSVYFQVQDEEMNTLYNSKLSQKNYWDFSVQSTQNFKVIVTVPNQRNNVNFNNYGCVSLIVGFKEN